MGGLPADFADTLARVLEHGHHESERSKSKGIKAEDLVICISRVGEIGGPEGLYQGEPHGWDATLLDSDDRDTYNTR
jgi:hypothetical protein